MTNESHRNDGARFVLGLSAVMPGFMPGIHVFARCTAVKTWMRGTSPRMTVERPTHSYSTLPLVPAHSRPKDGVLTPAYAGTQGNAVVIFAFWVPAFAGTNG